MFANQSQSLEYRTSLETVILRHGDYGFQPELGLAVG